MRGRGGVDRVASVVEDWWNTRLVVEDPHAVRYSRWVWWFGPQNSAVTVPEGTGGCTRRDRGGCIKAKQLRVKDVAVGSKT